MNLFFMLKCFGLGMSAASGVGPIFVLTFNRGALRGFSRGFATAMGSAFGDALLFFLGIIGFLSLLQGSKNIVILFNLIGGFSLIAFGLRMIKSTPIYIKERISNQESFSITMIKSFFLTVINPFAILFFIMVNVRLLPVGSKKLPLFEVITGSTLVGLGSLIALSFVALFASKIGKTINTSYLSKASYISGIAFIITGMYFLSDAAALLLRFFSL